ncbi:LOW QUALITY PROTEIN: alpha-1,6-mannosyl-glycoprotein 2-beta-N-acetylglucosaminyltransferase-like [Lolium rigidum]|uniref:LOW QUALITY PROTEIN: alpha-1,6-mannosyl-glycoprotein 2-beta-N-acetylglucosaminyltransferase-like n=1 Tax=Lolium rigidum TaxID=89674 RepID=UPI001F5C2BC1|nr:LOW QUALITY PROTEIN: alpha-1,6-mannosyl-glycoprotein 2-beta-N-acetylglucosaminyltransferase-like [Lolium rigidum]
MVKVAGQLCAVYCELLGREEKPLEEKTREKKNGNPSSHQRGPSPTRAAPPPAESSSQQTAPPASSRSGALDPGGGAASAAAMATTTSSSHHHRARLRSRAAPLFAVVVLAVLAVTALLRASHRYGDLAPPAFAAAARRAARNQTIAQRKILLDPSFTPRLPRQSALSLSLAHRNALPPRNADRFPSLPDGHLKIVLYVHNRPRYLRLVVDSLSRVDGIGEALLIVSHDGYFPEMDEIVKAIAFCQVKQIFAPYSPHLFPDSFPGVTPGDCRDKEKAAEKRCQGNPDQYGNHRAPRIVSLKHHWWWMMNTVWDGLEETTDFDEHILFIEEDHYIFPNAYRNAQLLVDLKPKKCPQCYAVNLAPSDVKAKGEGWESMIAEKMGNIGYAFNRTVWRKIHAKAKQFCTFDEYNWDITMWATVYPSFGAPVYSLRGPRRSAAHFGKCGLHQGHDPGNVCADNGVGAVELDAIDKVPNIKADWPVHVIRKQQGYQAGFKGWGGWGDRRDQELCLSFAYMYHVKDPLSA